MSLTAATTDAQQSHSLTNPSSAAAGVSNTSTSRCTASASSSYAISSSTRRSRYPLRSLGVGSNFESAPSTASQVISPSDAHDNDVSSSTASSSLASSASLARVSRATKKRSRAAHYTSDESESEDDEKNIKSASTKSKTKKVKKKAKKKAKSEMDSKMTSHRDDDGEFDDEDETPDRVEGEFYIGDEDDSLSEDIDSNDEEVMSESDTVLVSSTAMRNNKKLRVISNRRSKAKQYSSYGDNGDEDHDEDEWTPHSCDNETNTKTKAKSKQKRPSIDAVRKATHQLMTALTMEKRDDQSFHDFRMEKRDAVVAALLSSDEFDLNYRIDSSSPTSPTCLTIIHRYGLTALRLNQYLVKCKKRWLKNLREYDSSQCDENGHNLLQVLSQKPCRTWQIQRDLVYMCINEWKMSLNEPYVTKGYWYNKVPRMQPTTYVPFLSLTRQLWFLPTLKDLIISHPSRIDLSATDCDGTILHALLWWVSSSTSWPRRRRRSLYAVASETIEALIARPATLVKIDIYSVGQRNSKTMFERSSFPYPSYSYRMFLVRIESTWRQHVATSINVELDVHIIRDLHRMIDEYVMPQPVMAENQPNVKPTHLP